MLSYIYDKILYNSKTIISNYFLLIVYKRGKNG